MVVDFFQAKGNLPIENLIRPSFPIILSEERSNNSSHQKTRQINTTNQNIKKVKIGENRKTLENKIKSLEPLKTLLNMMMMRSHGGKPRTFIQTECEKIIVAFANADLDAETLKSLFEQSETEMDEEWFKETISRQLKDFWSLYAPVGSNMEKIVFYLATSPQCKQWLESGKLNLLMEISGNPSLSLKQQFSHSANPLRKKQQQVNVEAQVGLNFCVKKSLKKKFIIMGNHYIGICILAMTLQEIYFSILRTKSKNNNEC